MSAEKAALRRLALDRREAVHDSDRGVLACARLTEVLQPDLGRPAAGYTPIRSELDPRPAMAALAAAGPVGLPVIVGAGLPLRFCRWQPGCSMVPGRFGAEVPASDETVVPEIVIVPLLAFDRRGARLGYGGGYYDRTLQVLRAARPVRAIGLAYAAQELDRLPVEPTDQPLDAIVTEAEVIHPVAP